MNRYYPLLISLILNLVILFGYMPKKNNTVKKSDTSFLVHLEEKKEIVETITINNEIPDKIFAYGKTNQKVEKETKGDSIFRDLASVKTGNLKNNRNNANDLPLNDIALLNTKEFAYWNYYQDIRERIERYWGKSIEHLAKKFNKRNLMLGQNTTYIKVILSNQGIIENIILEYQSGIEEFDLAAIDAFNKAGPFPNPPQGILSNNQAIIEWRFIVNA